MFFLFPNGARKFSSTVKEKGCKMGLFRDNPGLTDKEEITEQEHGYFMRLLMRLSQGEELLKFIVIKRHQLQLLLHLTLLAGIRLVPPTKTIPFRSAVKSGQVESTINASFEHVADIIPL